MFFRRNKDKDKPKPAEAPRPTEQVPKRLVQPHAVSPLGQSRYIVEHKIMVSQFFSDPRRLMDFCVGREDGLYSLYKLIFEKNGQTLPYQPGDFRAIGERFEDHLMVCVIPPMPEYVPLCYRIYMLCGEDGSDPAYFTVERSMDDKAYLCRWIGETHCQIGKVEHPRFEKGNEGMQRAVEMLVVNKQYRGEPKA